MYNSGVLLFESPHLYLSDVLFGSTHISPCRLILIQTSVEDFKQALTCLIVAESSKWP